MTTRLVRTSGGWGTLENGRVLAVANSLSAMLRGAPLEQTDKELDPKLLAPIETQPVWASGVTYERSLVARTEESQEPDVYERVYDAKRPELFFKANGPDVVGPDGIGTVRSDSRWDVPEPELVLVLDSHGAIFGYTIGDDISSRSIEGENPLYLPQAKVYTGSCVIGPWIVPATEVGPDFDISIAISRADETIFSGTISTEKMHRSFGELASWLFRGVDFPDGAFLMTGTGLVPTDEVSITDGDLVSITVDQIGTLTHGVRTLNCEEKN